VRALLHIPAEVAALDGDADLLPEQLADVGDDEFVAAAPVERKAVRVAEPAGPDLVEARPAHERVVRRDAVGDSPVDVDAKNVAEQVLLDVLAIAAGVDVVPVRHVAEPDVIRPAPVAERDLQIRFGDVVHRVAAPATASR
jgi:hypothetical protein